MNSKDIFIECHTGLAGDMLMAAFLDLGVPYTLIKDTVSKLGIADLCEIKVDEETSFGIRGLKARVKNIKGFKKKITWTEFSKVIIDSSLEVVLKEKIYKVYQLLAEAESEVHGCKLEEVHFHEIGRIDSLIDIAFVSAAIYYLKPNNIFCQVPPAGKGMVKTSHGLLPVPVPVVLQLAKKNNIPLSCDENTPFGELTTPTGLALMAVWANSFSRPSLLNINKIGVGIGSKELDRPNLVRVFDLSSESNQSVTSQDVMHCQQVVFQEAWVDDSTPEDISAMVNLLRKAGALEVVTQSIHMKKGRQGLSIKVIVPQEKATNLRSIWFSCGLTIGIRERIESRWVLPRRKGYFITPYGKVGAKQVRRPDGATTIKIEHDDLVRIHSKFGKSIEEIRREMADYSKDFIFEEDWTC